MAWLFNNNSIIQIRVAQMRENIAIIFDWFLTDRGYRYNTELNTYSIFPYIDCFYKISIPKSEKSRNIS